jgi:hypothetical protein
MGWEIPPLFERHGVVQPLIYWDSFAGDGAPLYAYLLRWRSLDERFKAFGGFYADPEWSSQLAASNVGESMIDRLDLMILRPSEVWPAIADDRLRAGSGLHELRLQRLSTKSTPEALRRLADFDLPFCAAHGATPLGLFTTWFGGQTPQAVMLIEWPDFAARQSAVEAQNSWEQSSDRLRDERKRYNGPLLLDCDIHLMSPAAYPLRLTSP